MASQTVSLLAVGDVGLGWRQLSDPMSLFSYTADAIREADLAVCQLEAVPSELGEIQVHADVRDENIRGRPSHPEILRDVGFDVVSFASNHCMDLGARAFLDALENLARAGIPVVGAGTDVVRARRPAVMRVHGMTVAFLAYCSVLNAGFAAGPTSPGAAPMRAHTFYEPVEWQPAARARMFTVPDPDDLGAFEVDIRTAAMNADCVVVNMHWGVHFSPKTVADYQRRVAHAAVDAGADAVIGHHPHILHAVEIYRGKPIFYSLANFAMVMTRPPVSRRIHPFETDPTYALYQFPVDSKKSAAVRFVISRDGIERVALLPVFIEPDARPRILTRNDPRFTEVADYIQWTSDGSDATFELDGDELVVTTATKSAA